jgi:hypothetical protein
MNEHLLRLVNIMSCSGNGINDHNITTLKLELPTLKMFRIEQEMKKPPQEYQQQHAHRVNCQQLKASSPTNKNTLVTVIGLKRPFYGLN